MRTPRSIEEIIAAAATGSQRKRAKAIFEREAQVHAIRDKLKYYEGARPAVEFYFGRPLAEITGPERQFAEAVALRHDSRAIVDLSENYLTLLLSDAALGTVPLLREINQSLVQELDVEIEAVSAWLQAAWSVLPMASTIEDAEPLQWLRHRRWQADQGAQSGAGGANGLRSALKGLV